MRWLQLAAAGGLLAICPKMADAMRAADITDPVSAGAEIGGGAYGGEGALPTSGGAHFIIAGDMSYGFRSGLFGKARTAIQLDAINAAEPSRIYNAGPFTTTEDDSSSITTLGLMQPVFASPGFAIAIEGGGSEYSFDRTGTYTNTPFDYTGDSSFTTSDRSFGLFVGVRSSVHLRGVVLTAMLRTHFHSGQVNQGGIGLSGHFRNKSLYGWQLDYHTFTGSGSQANLFLAGIRFTL